MHEIRYSCFALVVAGLGLVTATSFGAQAPASEGSDTPPPGVEQLLARGAIAAIVEPEFVGADKAKIAPEAWVLGVEIEGQARAYSLNLLNRHEVVNDKIGERAFAAVW